MPPRKIFDPDISPKPMRIACFMSGSGTNVIKIIENQSRKGDKCSYQVVLIFTDVYDPSNQRCKAQSISSQYRISYEHNDMMEFYGSHGRQNRKDLSLRPEYDRVTLGMIEKYNPHLIALCGYMSIVTLPLIERYNGRIVNVHPADLSIKEGGKRKYTGLNAVRDAILAGEKKLYSTVHVVREKVDYGEILMRSQAVDVILPNGISVRELRDPRRAEVVKRIADEHQTRLKEKGDWVIYPKTLKMIGEGRYALNDHRNVYVDNMLMPNGFRL